VKGLCLKVEYGDFDMATCGDINGVDDGSRTNVESAVVATMGDVEVAKVNHHGSSFSSNSTWVSTLDAQVSVIPGSPRYALASHEPAATAAAAEGRPKL